jgi:Tfp pilus assembly protein PilX
MRITDRLALRSARRRHSRRAPRRGATALVAMLFLLLASTLTLGMYSMATLNVQGADNLSDNERARSAAESGLRWTTWRFSKLSNPKTAKGNIDRAAAIALWPAIRTAIAAEVDQLPDDQDDMTWDAAKSTYTSSYIRILPASTSNSKDPRFLDNTYQIVVRQHPLNDADKLDERYLRVTSVGRYGNALKTVSLDFVIDKKIKYAMIGKVPIQLGRNTLVEGPIAMTSAGKYPPILMLSDFKHLTSNLKSKIESFESFLEVNHRGYDNRIFVNDPLEGPKALAAGYRDYNGDSYIDEYDLFLYEFDRDGDRAISKSEFTNPATGKLYDPDLFLAIDTLGGPLKPGDTLRPGLSYRSDGSVQGDDVINANDAYTKVRGQIFLAATANAWQANAPAGQTVKDYIAGPISNSEDVVNPPLKFGATLDEMLVLNPSAFDTSSFRLQTGPENGPTSKSATLIENKVLAASDTTYTPVDERTPLGSASFQATYHRPVFKNMTFKNCRIPKGLNALFQNCTFEGVTFVELTTAITNGSGQVTTSSADGATWSRKMVSGSFSNTTVLTSANSQGYQKGNNLRFDNCTIKGPLVSDVPTAYTHFTNSWEFTGSTKFDNTWVDASGHTTATIIGPQTNIEMGSFTDPAKAPSTLKGVVVAGNIDIRGSSLVDGSIIVTGDGAANTTLGWFGASDSETDTAGPMPEGGYGRLTVRYNPYLPLPDGINMAIEIAPVVNEYNQNTYTEGN